MPHWRNSRNLRLILLSSASSAAKLSSVAAERETWIRHFFYLALFAAAFHSLQFLASLMLWIGTNSAVLMAYGLDAAVSAVAALVLAAKIQREWRNKFVAYGYM